MLGLNKIKTFYILSFFIIFLILILSYLLIDNSYNKSNLQKKTLIKNSFNLVNQEGKPVSHRDFYGKFTLIYFGFTFCPDVCPNTLNNISLSYDLLEDTIKNELKIIFITIDPERDTPVVLKDYISYFNPNFFGLTGSIKQTKSAAKSFGVYFKKTYPNENEGDDYLIDHSSIIFLMDPRGNYLSHFSRELTPNELSLKINDKLLKYLDSAQN